METITLKDAFKEKQELNYDQINRKLLAMHQMSVLQMNLATDIETELNRAGKYRYQIKHNHQKIKTLIRQHFVDLFKNLDQKQTDAFCDDADSFETLVNNFFGIK